MKKLTTTLVTVLFLLAAGGLARAQERTLTGGGELDGKAKIGFLEAAGGYGFQFGEQEYVPTSDGSYTNPLTNGYSVGVTAGWEFLSGLSLIGNWEFARSQSVNGEVVNALDKVEGVIDYHTVALGLRWTRQIGPGRLFGELGGGLILPFQTEVQYAYADAMAAVDVAGEGKMIDEYNLGYGAYGQLGYQWDITGGFYLGTSIRVKSFQSDNNGKQTRFENFVVDFTHPAATTMTIDYDSAGPVAPKTYSVQDLRMQVALGFRL